MSFLVFLFVIFLVSSQTLPYGPYIENHIRDKEVEFNSSFYFRIPCDTFRVHGRGLIQVDILRKPSWMNVDIDQTLSLSSCYDIIDASDIFVVGDFAYITNYIEKSLEIVNITVKQSPTLVESFDIYEYVGGVYVEDNIAYVASNDLGLNIVNVTNPNEPTQIGFLKELGSVADVYVLDDYAYVIDSVEAGTGGLRIIDVSTKDSPTLVSSYETSGLANTVFVEDNYAYITYGELGFKIVDISIKDSPTLVLDDGPTLGYSRDICVSGNLTFQAENHGGFHIYDTSNKNTPIDIGFPHYDQNIVRGVTVVEDLAYVVDRKYGLKVVNVSNPNVPRIVKTLSINDDISGEGGRVFMADNYVYIAVLNEGVKIACVSDHIDLSGRCDRNGIVSVQAKSKINNDGQLFFSDIVDEFRVTCVGDIYCNGVNSVLINDVCSGKGSCVENDTCECMINTFGENCELLSCHGVFTNTSSVCSGHGECISHDTCDCEVGYTDIDFLCSWSCYGYKYDDEYGGVCSKHGSCIDIDKCSCEDTYHGLECDENIVSADYEDRYERRTIVVRYTISKNTIEKSNRHILLQDRFQCSEMIENYEEFFSSEVSDCYFSGTTDQDDDELDLVFTELFICIHTYDDESGDLVDTLPPVEYSIVIKSVSNPTEDQKELELLGLEKQETPDMPDYSWIGVVVPLLFSLTLLCFCCTLVCGIGIVCACCMFGCGVLGCIGSVTGSIMMKQREGINRFKRLKDFNLLLQEQMLESDSNVPHLRINKKLFSIPFDEIKIERIIGEGGSQSIVFLAKWSGKRVAFKCFKTRSVCSNQDSFKEFEKEVEILSSLNHPHIIQFFGATLKPPRVGIVMEYCENGDIDNFIKSFKEKFKICFPILEKIRILNEIISACSYLHSRSVIHRDLKLENILLDSEISSKFIDFGLSRIVDSMSKQKTKKIGTNFYIAPEIIASSFYDEKCDVFSFGILIYVFISEIRDPYGINSNFNIEIKVATDPNLRPNVTKFRESLGDDHEKYEWLVEIMKRCWKHDSKERNSFKELVELFEKEMSLIDDGGSRLNFHNLQSIKLNEDVKMRKNAKKNKGKKSSNFKNNNQQEQLFEDQSELIERMKRKLEEICDTSGLSFEEVLNEIQTHTLT